MPIGSPDQALKGDESVAPPSAADLAAFFNRVYGTAEASESDDVLGADCTRFEDLEEPAIDPVLSITDDVLVGVRVAEETARMIGGYMAEIEAVLSWLMEDVAITELQKNRAALLISRARMDCKGKVSEKAWGIIEERIVDLEYLIDAMRDGVMMSHEYPVKLPSRQDAIDIIKAYVETSPRFHPKLEFYSASDFQVDPRFRGTLECSDGKLAYGIHVFDDGQLAVVIN